MTTTTVYRVQTSDNAGPYNEAIREAIDHIVDTLGEEHPSVPSYVYDYYATHRPVPYFDYLPHVQSSEYFGFESPEALKEWFLSTPEDVPALEAFNLKVVAYTVPVESVRKGTRQLVFEYCEATVLSVFELHELAELLA